MAAMSSKQEPLAVSEEYMQSMANLYEEIGESYTVRIAGEIAVCFGAHKVSDWSADSWAMFTGKAATRPLPIVRAMRALLERYCETNGVHRVQLSVIADFGTAERLALLLGYRLEGPLRCYGPERQTFFRYAYCPGEA